MDVFQLRNQVVEDYARYMGSFIELRDDRIKALVEDRLASLWPEPLVQLNPAFEPGEAMEQLVADGLLHPACGEIFQLKREGAPPKPLRLYRHQIDGIRAARSGDNYVLTTGTGSGKSLSYIVPIVDHILRSRAQDRRGIQAIVVYPMNALANSQLEELRKYLELGFTRPLVSFDRYTGQESQQERERIRANPPDILLTNYVMLELVLTRPEERRLIEAACGLRFLVFDELHTYRGRQGADVAMLCRRVREACRAQNMIHVGTSATLASEGTWDDQRREVARVASLIFGASVEPRRVIGETLRRITPELDFDDPAVLDALRRRVEQGAVPHDSRAFTSDPLAAWIESTLGIRLRDGRLVRQQPRPLSGSRGAARELAALTHVSPERCEATISDTLMAGYRHQVDGRPLFAFRLHQFISKGDTVYASLGAEDQRFLTMQVQQFVPGSDRQQILLPLCFCRECGQEFYSVRRGLREDGLVAYTKRDVADQLDSEDGEAGYLYINTRTPWPHESDSAILRHLPDSWLEEHKGKLRIRSERKKRLPREVTVSPLGLEGQGQLRAHFIGAPFLFCPTCGVAYDARQKSDFGKLGTLGSEGRSTATTLLSLSALRHLRHAQGIGSTARKLLSFTDNRQDAALQAGHFNDFISLGLVRSSLYRALEQAGEAGIRHEELPQRVFDALDLPIRLYAQNPEVLYGQREATQRALRRVLGYSIYRDLARGWRLTSPNLEQCGLLTIEYRALETFCNDAAAWSEHPLLAAADPALRRSICEVLLNYLRRELAIDIEFLDPDTQEQIRLDSNQLLIDPWRLGDTEKLVHSHFAVPGSSSKARGGAPRDTGRFVYVSPRGGFGQYLRRSNVLGAFGKLSLDDTGPVITALFQALTRLGLLRETTIGRRGAGESGYQLKAAGMIWHRGKAESAAHDPIRVPQIPDDGLRPNSFFIDFYRAETRDLVTLQAHEHTAQVRADERERRENSFRKAELPLLFCSPTMELGVDIAELNVVNMRNVPPTPANYAQRSGRAGRSGQPAFVFTYCTASSPHDHYFFKHPERMVAGEVAPPRLDLANEDLLRAHVHAIWLAESGLSLGSSLAELLDIRGEQPTLDPLPHVVDALQDASARARAYSRASSALGPALAELFPDPEQADNWLRATLDGLLTSFRNACERWRSLFLAAHTQVRKQRAAYDDRSLPHVEREQARRLLREADSQLDLLVDRGAELNSDFYSYRYFASEGFLPGYNFPRLPLSAYLPSPRRRAREAEEFLSRPRFLAVSEFGPNAIIYHEGSRYVIGKVILGADAEAAQDGGLLTRAYRCEHCGYVEVLSDTTAPEFCPECGGKLNGVDTNLFRMRNVTARRRDRITSDEEERLRIGYDLRTNIHFTAVDGRPRKAVATLVEAGEVLARLTYGHAADVWRINLGWRRRKVNEVPGFLLDTQTGAWVRSQNPEDPDADPDEPTTPRQTRVIPFVKDTRNCLLLEPAGPLGREAMASLQAALKTAIQLEFQLEDRELAAEPLPSRNDRRRILFYEAAEGGAGVLRRLVDEPRAFARVARRALELCHFDPDTLADHGHAPGAREQCVAACYDCLLSYFNQTDHGIVDRHHLPELLRRWAGAAVESSPVEAPRTDHLGALLRACDSELERRWLTMLSERGHRLPHRAQVYVPEAETRLDFLYEPTGSARVAIYIDGPHHDSPDIARRDIEHQELLEDFGYTVIRFHHAADWSAILARFPHVFGAREAPAPAPAAPASPAVSPAVSPADPLAELLDLFEPPWRPLVRQLAAVPRLTIDAGAELGERVAATYLARIDQDERSVFLVDADDPKAAKAAELLAARSRRALILSPTDPDALSKVLAALRT